MKVLAGAFASLLLLPVLVLSAFAGTASTPTFDGPGGELAAEVLADPRIALTPGARADVRAGLIDARILAILMFAAEGHELGVVGPLVSGHNYYVKGTTRASNHAFGRAVDISVVDGASVSGANLGALALAREILQLPAELWPDELGSPWELSAPGVRTFTKDHDDHLHVGFEG